MPTSEGTRWKITTDINGTKDDHELTAYYVKATHNQIQFLDAELDVIACFPTNYMTSIHRVKDDDVG